MIIGDGFNAKDIAEGDCLPALKEAAQYLITVEPYKTYSKYFNIYIGFAMSNESGIGSVNTIRYNRFGTTFTGGSGLSADYDEIFSYALNAPTVNQNNLNQTLIIIVPNTTEYGGITQMWEDGSAIAFCPRSTDAYPYDSRGVCSMRQEAMPSANLAMSIYITMPSSTHVIVYVVPMWVLLIRQSRSAGTTTCHLRARCTKCHGAI